VRQALRRLHKAVSRPPLINENYKKTTVKLNKVKNKNTQNMISLSVPLSSFFN